MFLRVAVPLILVLGAHADSGMGTVSQVVGSTAMSSCEDAGATSEVNVEESKVDETPPEMTDTKEDTPVDTTDSQEENVGEGRSSKRDSMPSSSCPTEGPFHMGSKCVENRCARWDRLNAGYLVKDGVCEYTTGEWYEYEWHAKNSAQRIVQRKTEKSSTPTQICGCVGGETMVSVKIPVVVPKSIAKKRSSDAKTRSRETPPSGHVTCNVCTNHLAKGLNQADQNKLRDKFQALEQLNVAEKIRLDMEGPVMKLFPKKKQN